MSNHQLAAVAAVSHAKAYNLTRQHSERTPHLAYLGVHVFFASATICGVMLAVCVACWRKTAIGSKLPTPSPHRQRALDVYAIEIPTEFYQEYVRPVSGPPPAYESVVDKPPTATQPHISETEAETTTYNILNDEARPSCNRCGQTKGPISEEGLPTYEAALQLKEYNL